MKIAIYGQFYKEGVSKYLEELFSVLEKNNIDVVVERKFYDAIKKQSNLKVNYPTFSSYKDLDKSFAMLITVGGDGTFLRSITFVRDTGIPILGLNVGRLGFLANIQKDKIAQTTVALINKEYKIIERSLLKVKITPEIPNFSELNVALNEVTIVRKNSTSMITVETHLDNEWNLINVKKIRLDQIIWPYRHTKISITFWNNNKYYKNMQWTTYNVVWGRDKRTWKYTYVFESWPYKRQRVLISDGDKLGEYHEKERTKSINVLKNFNINREYINISERNKSFIDWLKLPNNYKKIALEFASKLRHNEILTKKTPIALVDASKKEMLYTVNWRKKFVQVLLWKNWITYWW